MKKLLFVLALIIGVISSSYAKTLEEIFKSFESEENVQLITIDESMLSVMMAGAGEDAEKLKNVESMVVLELTQSDQSVKDRFVEETSALKLDGHEMLTRVNQDSVTVKVLGKVDGDTVRDLVIIVTGEAYVLMEMKGSISMSDVQDIVKSNS